MLPNERQPRLGPKEDEELQRQIEANEGLFEPLLVEPHPDLPDKFRIIDGERRWTNSSILVAQGREQYRQIPVEITDRTLTDDERLRVWIYIHRQRKEWDAKEKEMVAYRLVDLSGARARPTSSASRCASWTSSLRYSSCPRSSPACAIRAPRSLGRAS